jgi:hypothetical protein
LIFTFIGFDPEEGEELAQRASILVKNDLLDKWGDYVLTVMVSDNFKNNLLDKSGAYIYAPSVNVKIIYHYELYNHLHGKLF